MKKIDPTPMRTAAKNDLPVILENKEHTGYGVNFRAMRRANSQLAYRARIFQVYISWKLGMRAATANRLSFRR